MPKYPWPELSLTLKSIENSDIKICDFGEAFIWDMTLKCIKSNMPHGIAAAEVLLSASVTPSMNAWALVCLMFMFLTNHQLFPGEVQNHTLQLMVLSLGKFPDSLWTPWNERTEYFGENANFSWYPSLDLHPKVPAFKLMSIINELWRWRRRQ